MGDLVGIPFLDRGRDLQGADCWGVFRLAQARFGNCVPDVSVSAFDTEEIGKRLDGLRAGWRRVDSPATGDAVAIAFDHRMPDTVQHVGVYVGAGKFLHTMEKTGSILVPLDHPFWKNRIRGFYRWSG